MIYRFLLENKGAGRFVAEVSMDERRSTRSARRRFLRLIPGAVAGAIAAPALARQAEQTTPRITKDNLDCAEKIFGIDFNDGTGNRLMAGTVMGDPLELATAFQT